MRSYFHSAIRSPTQKKETNPIAREPSVGGEREKAKEHVLTCHSVTRFRYVYFLQYIILIDILCYKIYL